MITAIAAAFVIAPAGTSHALGQGTRMVLDKRFNLILKSVSCVNPSNLVRPDHVYGRVLALNMDPNNPSVIGYCDFEAGPLKRGDTAKLPPGCAILNFEAPLAPANRQFHIMMVEQDMKGDKQDQQQIRNKVRGAYLQTFQDEMPGFLRTHKNNPGKVMSSLFWSTMKKIRNIKRFDRSDEQMAGWLTMGHGERSFTPADENGFDNFVEPFWLHQLGMNLTRYKVSYRIEQVK